MELLQNNIPDDGFLSEKIKNYDYRNITGFIGNPTDTGNLSVLKAIDSVKDGASVYLAKEVFGTNTLPTQSDCKNLPARIMIHFQQKVTDGLLRRVSYTRRKDGLNTFDGGEEVNYNYAIPDCGPTYTTPGGKTPVITPPGGGRVTLLYSLGNKMDSGPSSSSSNAINLRCNQSYTITESIFKTLGYAITNMNVNGDTFQITLGGKTYDSAAFKRNAQGNNTKNNILTQSSSTLDLKKMLLFFKSLGDTLIGWFWIWACRSAPAPKIALLTCDTVLAFQADIISQGVNNAYWLLNYSQHGDKHISYVFVKDTPINYTELFAVEKRRIVNRYTKEIEHFENMKNNERFEIQIGNGNLRDSILNIETNLIKPIIDRLTEERDKIAILEIGNTSDATQSKSYTLLKSYDLLSLIQGFRDNTYTLIRSRKQFNRADSVFLPGFKYKLNLEAIITILKQRYPYQMGGRNQFYEKLYEENFLNPQISQQHADTEAIKQLQSVISTIFKTICKENYNKSNLHREIQLHKEIQKYIEDIGLYKHDTLGSLYDMLTYDFYANTDHSNYRIQKLCEEVFQSIEESVKVITGISIIKTSQKIVKRTRGGPITTTWDRMKFTNHPYAQPTRRNANKRTRDHNNIHTIDDNNNIHTIDDNKRTKYEYDNIVWGGSLQKQKNKPITKKKSMNKKYNKTSKKNKCSARKTQRRLN